MINGEYMVISNLGSMIPRYIYAPTEEVCYNLFAKLDQEGTQEAEEKKKKSLTENELNILKNIFKIINILGSLVAIFGIIYGSSILDFLYGGLWSSQVTNFNSF